MNEKKDSNQFLLSELLLVSAANAAKLLSIGRSLFYSMDSSGELGPQSIKFGRRSLWRLDELRAWIYSGCPGRDRWIAMRGKGLKSIGFFPELRLLRQGFNDINKIPLVLRGIEKLQSISPLIVNDISGVYFLCLTSRVMYVGESEGVNNRVRQHIKAGQYDFDSAFYISISGPESARKQIETHYIEKLHPPYNKPVRKKS